MHKKTITYLFAGSAVFWFFFLFISAHAATLNITADTNEIVENQNVTFTVTLDTQGADANTVQGSVLFPSGSFKLAGISDGASAVSLWVQSPQQTSAGEIDFAGIIPGGYTGSQVNIFSFTLQPLGTGSEVVSIATGTVFANDGQGTPLSLTLSSTSVTVNPSNSSSTPTEPTHDLTAPNPFTPMVESDPNIFGGKYFLVFNTTDNESGIDHYEVLEVPSGQSEQPFSSWHVATSPYLLTDQTLSSDIYVRAVDHDGNFTVVTVPAKYPNAQRVVWNWLAIGALIIMILLVVWEWRRRSRR